MKIIKWKINVELNNNKTLQILVTQYIQYILSEIKKYILFLNSPFSNDIYIYIYIYIYYIYIYIYIYLSVV